MRRIALACATLLGACSFERPGLGPDVDGGGPTGVDARPGTADAPPGDIDAGPCPAEVVIAVQIDGVPVDETTMPKAVLVGDSVRISFDGTCVAAGAPVINWTLSPVDGTAATELGEPDDFTVYSVAGDVTYVLDVEVSGETRTIAAFHTHGFETISGLSGNDADIRHLDTGGGRLWITTKNHGWSMDLAAPGSFTDLTATWNLVDTLPNAQRAVHHDGTYVWFGLEASTNNVYRGNVALGYFQAVDISHDLAFGGAAIVYNIEAAAPGVHVAASDGVATSDTGEAFLTAFAPDLDPAVFDVALAPPRAWGGGRALYDLGDPSVALYPFGGTGDQLIRHLETDGDGSLWIGSDGNGLARVEAATGETIQVWDSTTGLASDDVDELTVASDGDVWFIYRADGIGRWKKDRNEIANLGLDSGLTSSQLDARAIQFHESASGRIIFAGTLAGLVYAHVP